MQSTVLLWFVVCLYSVTSVTYIDYAVSVVQLFKLLSSIIHYDV